MTHTVDYCLAKDSEDNDQGNLKDYRFSKKMYERRICCLSVVILLLVIGAAVMAYFLYGFYTANINLNQRLMNENDCRDGLVSTTTTTFQILNSKAVAFAAVTTLNKIKIKLN